MNRLSSVGDSSSTLLPPAHHLGSPVGPSAVAAPDFRRRRFARSLAEPYSLFGPVHYEGRYAYPLLVWFHDEGSSEAELPRLMPYVSVRNYVAGAVRGTASSGSGSQRFGWDRSAAGVSEAIDRTRQCMDAATSEYNIHERRVFLAGYGAGGTAALQVALSAPEWFAGAISIGGPAPRGNAPLRQINRARKLPLMLSYCRDGAEYPPSRVGEDLRLFHAAGFPLAVFQYPGEHDLTTIMLQDMDRWIMDRVCGGSAS